MTLALLLNETASTYNVPDLHMIEHWINIAIEHSPIKPADTVESVSMRIVTENESAGLNEQFRQKTGPTNVLAFPHDPMPGVPEDSLGDIAICADVVNDEAHNQGKTLEAHWAHITIHGILHCLGFDHIKPDDAKVMEALEINILATLGFPNPYEIDEERIHDA